jgi:opacity protein-like surface antigen
MKIFWTAAFTSVVILTWSPTVRAQYGGSIPQPLTQAAYCPTCAQDGGPYASPGGGYPPWQPWSNAAAGPPAGELYRGYSNLDDTNAGWYIGGITGAVFLADQKSEAVNPNVNRVIDGKFDWNAAGGMMIGYRFPVHPRDLGQLRIEFDTIYRDNGIKTLLSNEVEFPDALGEATSTSFMFNVALDFTNWHGWITPYVAGGVGVLYISEILHYGNARLDDHDVVFAFQGMAGASIKLWENVELFTEFRYLGGSNPKLQQTSQAAPILLDLRSEYNTYGVMGGVRINLY